jgi:hypothetical protein
MPSGAVLFPLRMTSDKNMAVPTVHVWMQRRLVISGRHFLYDFAQSVHVWMQRRLVISGGHSLYDFAQSVHVWMQRRLFISGGHSLYDFAQSVQEKGGCAILRPES